MFDVLSPDKLKAIRELNDALRTTFAGGKVMLTASVAELVPEIKAAAMMAMSSFSDFNEGNDPHAERDFGSFTLGQYSFIFKIDYYDKKLEFGSEDPADPDKTTRVLTLMLSGEY